MGVSARVVSATASILVGCESFGAPVWPRGVVVVPPVFDEHSGFGEQSEFGDAQQFISDLAVERLDPRVLPGSFWFDVDRAKASQVAPDPQDPGDHLRSVVHPDEARCTAPGNEPLQGRSGSPWE